MQIDKETILNFLREQGDHEKAKQADDQLPDQVDTERHGDLLERIGLDPDLLGRLGGGKIPGL